MRQPERLPLELRSRIDPLPGECQALPIRREDGASRPFEQIQIVNLQRRPRLFRVALGRAEGRAIPAETSAEEQRHRAGGQ